MEIREEKAAIIGIFIKDFDAVPKVNGILHDYAEDIIGRIGIPCRDRDLHVISIILSTTPDRISGSHYENHNQTISADRTASHHLYCQPVLQEPVCVHHRTDRKSYHHSGCFVCRIMEWITVKHHRPGNRIFLHRLSHYGSHSADVSRCYGRKCRSRHHCVVFPGKDFL